MDHIPVTKNKHLLGIYSTLLLYIIKIMQV